MYGYFVRLLGAFLAALALAGPMPAAAQSIFKPVAVVNDSAITGFDLAQRAQILTVLGASSGGPDQLRNEALNSLVEDRLKRQSAKQFNVELPDNYLSEGLAEIAGQINLSGDALNTRFTENGVSQQAIDDYIGTEVLWREVVRGLFLRRATPSEAAVDSELELAGNTTGLSFLLKRLALTLSPVSTDNEAVRAKILDLRAQAVGGADFDALIQAHDDTGTDPNRGDMGWVPASSLSGGLVGNLRALSPGDISQPITLPGGVAILQLVDSRQNSGANETSEQERDAVRRRMIGETINRLAEGYLQELRRDALIEVR